MSSKLANLPNVLIDMITQYVGSCIDINNIHLAVFNKNYSFNDVTDLYRYDMMDKRRKRCKISNRCRISYIARSSEIFE